MSDDEPQPLIANTGVTDPAAPAATATGSTPFGGTSDFGSIAATTATSAAAEWVASTFTSSGVIVAAALEEAAQAIIRPDVPLAMVDELLAAVQGPAVKSVLEARVSMVIDKGHTAESDDFLPIGWLPMEARQAFERVRDLLNDDDHRDLAAVRAMMVDGIAFGLAAIDRLDRAMKVGGAR